MFSYTKIATIVLAIIIGVPSVSMAGSITTSLIQGKTPSEALQVLSEQVDMLFGRIDSLETKQAEIAEDISNNQQVTDIEIEKLRLENENLKLKLDSKADVVLPPVESKECLTIKGDLEATREPFRSEIDILNKELSVLKKERSDLRKKPADYKSDSDDEIERFQEELLRIGEENDKLEKEIDIIENKIDSIQLEIKNAIAPIIQKADQNNCLLG